MASLKMQLPDWAGLALVTFEIPSFLFSQYRANSFRPSENLAVALLAYFVARLYFRTSRRSAIVSGFVALGGGWLAGGPHLQRNCNPRESWMFSTLR